ncbi:condensin subunit Smc [Deinococcus reticulitermitis]|uniref:Chromosome partition protein Smc n=1 Tax=Deinococcus reticulitermitis TaxID=856736 RepID=A0A1H7ASI6_9DEIO|nr:chromosome segregation SMC family protein [Deinococcus reticulitermitis]SEJ68563.1 condensin subunit Smc [Deinococcus reticulitermitis]
MIHTITLHGFKSFADRTRLEFPGGICAVIGPNGSGKSNVVEAIRWATHGARARELRAGRGRELIFHGSGGKAPLGLAEVELELQTTAGRVNVTRRVYRDGDGEQDLGGRPVRARDVQAALRGTGLGPGGLAVIGQGEVSSVVQAEGRTLLASLQEAAGLSGAVGARQETATRLTEAERHLEQLGLLLREREHTVARLESAALSAREHAALSARVLTLEDALRRERTLGLQREIAAAQAEAQAADSRSAALSAEVALAAQEVERSREAHAQARARLDAHAGALDTLRAAREAHAQAERYRQHLEHEREALTRELRALPRTPPAEPEPDLGALNAAVTGARAEAEQAEARARTLERELERLRVLTARAAEAAARSGGGLETLRRELERAEGNLETVRLALGPAREALALALKRREQAQAALSAAQGEREQAEAHERHLQAELARASATLAPLRRERERLEAALNSYARYGEGARNALRQDHPGILGSVADVTVVPAEFETAVTAALGRRLEQVVVQRAEDARAIIEELGRLGGRATFLPLDLLRARPRRDAALRREDGVIGNLADLCPTDPPLVGEAVLADTLIVEDLRAAQRLARAYPNRPRLVTRAGELIEPGGAITGGRLRDTGSAVLADQRRFQELQAEVEDAEAISTRLAAQLAALPVSGAAELAAQQTERDEAEREARAAEQRVTELAAQARSLEAHRAELLGQLRTEAAQRPAPTELPDLQPLEAELLAARQHAETARAAERAALEAQALARELGGAWRAFGQAQTRAGELRARLEVNAESARTQQLGLEGSAAEVARREAALGELDEGELPRAAGARDAAAQLYSTLVGEQNRVRGRLEELRVLIARREGSLDPLPDGCSPPGAPREWTAELGRARAQLDALGPVNARAEAEHRAELAALLAQQAEAADAQAAATELRSHLTGLEEAEEAATRAAFGRVGAAFREYSTELLGGSGELEPEEDERGRLSGLRLAVQPKGKRTRSLALLSTGERTMAGLGFLFALNHAGGEEGMGGLPLAVLDEVDAPLDEANIRRFTAFLKRFAERGTQFVLVTHQKATMEVAGALWGVTTDQTGASRVLSIKQPDEG